MILYIQNGFCLLQVEIGDGHGSVLMGGVYDLGRWSWTMMLVNDNIYLFSEGTTVLFLFFISDKWRNV